MRRGLFGLFLLAISALPAASDVGPPPPPSPPPPGPDKATIRGVSLTRAWTYWRGRRWMTIVDGCAAAQAACKDRDLKGCFVVGIGDRPLRGGDIAAVVAAEQQTGSAPLKLKLENCTLTEIDLK